MSTESRNEASLSPSEELIGRLLQSHRAHPHNLRSQRLYERINVSVVLDQFRLEDPSSANAPADELRTARFVLAEVIQEYEELHRRHTVMQDEHTQKYDDLNSKYLHLRDLFRYFASVLKMLTDLAARPMSSNATAFARAANSSS